MSKLNKLTSETDNLTKALKWVLLVFFIALILYFGKLLFVPLSFGLLVALIVFPSCNKMEKKGLSRSLSISVMLIFITSLFVGLIWLLGIEVNIFLGDLPKISDRITQLSPSVTKWIEQSSGLNGSDQSAWFHRLTDNFDSKISGLLTGIFNTTISTIVMLVMIPIYAALFLYHREMFVRYLELVSGPENQNRLHSILHESVYSYFKFVKGNFYVYCIVGVLNVLGLFALGIEHAFLYGMLTSFMMVIPYIGIFISAAIPVAIAFVTKDSIWYPIAVIVIFVIIQYLESNVIFPKVVGSQLNLSTWATLVAIIAATVLWGLAGMVLVTPFLSILKIITDYIPEWKPLNLLLNRAEGHS